jgi:hypothetical protein
VIIEKRSLIISVLGFIIFTTGSTILLTSEVEGGKDKDKDDKNKDGDNQLSEYDVAVLCGATEDYEANKEQCDKLYDMLEEGIIEDDPDFEYD